MSTHEVARALQEFLARRCGAEVSVVDLRVLAGGASRAIYGFDLVTPDACDEPPAVERLVLRMDPPPEATLTEPIDEHAVIAAAHAAGVTVPRVLWRGGSDEGLGSSFVVMERARGEAIARRLLREDCYREARAALPDQLARELARIHAVDPADPRLAGLHEAAQSRGERSFARMELARYGALLSAAAGGHPHPVLALTARWLDRAAPSSAEQTLVHGDFRIGNVLFDEAGLTAVLDWELAHVGDPMEDLGWLAVRAWRFGADRRPIGGLCGRETFWEAYERHSGRSVDPQRARYWEILGNWKWAAICIMQAARGAAEPRSDLELLAIGRRVAATEQELLRLLAEEGTDAR